MSDALAVEPTVWNTRILADPNVTVQIQFTLFRMIATLQRIQRLMLAASAGNHARNPKLLS